MRVFGAGYSDADLRCAIGTRLPNLLRKEVRTEARSEEMGLRRLLWLSGPAFPEQ